jgi:2-oxo-4-hydroxy-4-carboxy-5-ureidoimidazoline decarboxylase
MTVNELNSLSLNSLQEELTKCNGATNWVKSMCTYIPFKGINEVLFISEKVWNECTKQDWLEAFEHHPKIGDINSLNKKFANTIQWASSEQSSINQTTQQTIELLANKNNEYEKKFGFIFIVCATGKSAEEMLSLLLQRINNNKEDELIIAKNEQLKITQLRLKKLLS